MRERVTALSGRLHAGPRDGGGFQVRAENPGPGTVDLIRILLADDQSLIRSGIRSLLEAEDDIEVVAEAADGRQAVALAVEHRPDIALMDIQMPVLDGIEATRQIVADERLKEVRVVILTNFGLDEYIFRALRAGAAGFLLKETEPAGLLEALQVVMRGDSLLSPAITRRLISEFVARPPDAVAAAGMERLTNREREVAALVAHGLSNDEIAEAMVLSPATAKTHVSRAMIKLGARDRAQLVVFAYQAGLVTPKRREQQYAERIKNQNRHIERSRGSTPGQTWLLTLTRGAARHARAPARPAGTGTRASTSLGCEEVEARLRYIEGENAMPADDITVKKIPAMGVVAIGGTAPGIGPEHAVPVVNRARAQFDELDIPGWPR